MADKGAKGRKEEVVTREYTINLHKRLHGWVLHEFHMQRRRELSILQHIQEEGPEGNQGDQKVRPEGDGDTDVRVDVKLNKQIWSRGIRSVPRRVRVRISRKRNDDEDAKEELYSLVTVAEIPAEGLKGLGTKVIEEGD
ncbi:unnamed protein product [Spirodela intermedia]|uniref:Uncharacterized protein n=1 Tax=Spirodela intermedia TaxID=51605 RepID=A0A7I8JQ93_SPIIN|nr:unnamed protein product [Spirodela intermedia]CAA6672334.1 unnamed protein product [Spirodela intermedia]